MFSGFILTTNPIKRKYPIEECIRSWLMFIDELIIVDGGSNDGTVELIKKIKKEHPGKNIRFICNQETKWDDDWLYSRMNKNFNIGLENCHGDWVFKIDADWVLHRYKHRIFLENIDEVDFLRISLRNIILYNYYFFKSSRVIAISRRVLDKEKIKIGFDLKRSSWHNTFIIPDNKKNDMFFGKQAWLKYKNKQTNLHVFNYDYSFMDIDTARRVRDRHFRAINRTKSIYYKNKFNPSNDIPWDLWLDHKIDYYNNFKQNKIPIDQHPEFIISRLNNLTEKEFCYSGWRKIRK